MVFALIALTAPTRSSESIDGSLHTLRIWAFWMASSLLTCASWFASRLRCLASAAAGSRTGVVRGKRATRCAGSVPAVSPSAAHSEGVAASSQTSTSGAAYSNRSLSYHRIRRTTLTVGRSRTGGRGLLRLGEQGIVELGV